MSDKIKVLGSKEVYEKMIKGEKPVLVDFFATWCGPCQMMGMMLEEMAEKYKDIEKVEIVKIDIDEYADIASENGVMSVPTLKIFQAGKEIESYTGMRPWEDLAKKLDELLKK